MKPCVGKEVEMAALACPVCEEDILLMEKKRVLFQVMRCPICHVRLQVIHENPLRLEVFSLRGLSWLNDEDPLAFCTGRATQMARSP